MKKHADRLIDLLGRFVFGSWALASAAAFGTFACLLLTIRPAGLLKVVLHALLVDCFALASLFMLAAAAKSLSGAIWSDRVLYQLTPKAALFVVGFALVVYWRASWELLAG